MFTTWQVVLILLVSIAMASDIKERRIPNWLTGSGILLGIIIHLITGGVSGLVFSMEGSLLGVALLFLPFALGGMGAGDVKLLAAIGALMGPLSVFYTALFGGVIGGGMAVVAAARAKSLGIVVTGLFVKGVQSEIYIPYGIALGAGALIELIRLYGLIW